MSLQPPTGFQSTPHEAPLPGRSMPEPPLGLEVVGGRSMQLRRAIALDRLASGYGYLTISWSQRGHGLDLVAFQDGSVVAARGHTLTVDLSQPQRRVLIGTGTRGTMPLPASELLVSNGATQLNVPILGGTSLGFWPRLSITRVDGFVVVRHEGDPLSGVFSAVAAAYGYDERTFVMASTT